MESLISDLVSRFEKGALSRRELVQGLTMLAATGTAAKAAEADLDFKTANIDHISIQVTNLQRSTEFYQRLFGFTVVSEEKPLEIVRLGNNRTLVSLNTQRPSAIIDHFAIGVPNWTREAATRYLMQRGATVGNDPYHGLHTRDPDGTYVQLSLQR